MNWAQNIWEIIAAAVIIPLLGLAISRIRVLLKTRTTEITLKISEKVADTETKFGLLHVRDGKDGDDREKPKNEKHWFKRVDQQYNLKTSVRYKKNLGFQFKCFADCMEGDFDELKEMLKQNGYLHVVVAEDKGGTRRVWFIHPDYPICKTVDDIVNNFFYPE